MAARQGLKGLNPKAAEYFPRNQIITYHAPPLLPLVNPHLQPLYFPNLQTLSQPICRYSNPNPNPFPIPPEHKTQRPRNPNANRFGHRRRRAGNNRGDRWQQQRRPWRPMLGKPASCTNNGVVRNLNKYERNENHDDHHHNVKSCNFWGKKMMKRYSDVLPVVRDGNSTTVMIRNIPKKYNRDLLVAFLDNHCLAENRRSGAAGDGDGDVDDTTLSSSFDFLYLPIDFQTGFNKGYAFVNFTNPKAVWKFFLACHSRMWNLFHSPKIREIAYAKIQGKKELVEHFENIGFPCESEEVLPVCFSPARDGSGKVVEQRTVGRCMGSMTMITRPCS